MQTTGTLITASVATLLAAVSPVIADEHHHRGGGATAGMVGASNGTAAPGTSTMAGIAGGVAASA